MSTALATVDTTVALDVFVTRLNDEYDAWHDAHRNGLTHAISLGSMLIAAKAEYGQHGAWKPWLAENFKGSYPAAQRAMQIAMFAESNASALTDSETGQMPNTLTAALSVAKRHKAERTGRALRALPAEDPEEIVQAEVVYSLTLPQLVAFASKRWHRTPPTEEAVLAWLTENEIAA